MGVELLTTGRFAGRFGTSIRSWLRIDYRTMGRLVLIMGAAFVFLVLLFLPLLAVFAEALRKGWSAYFSAITEPECRSAFILSLKVLAIVLPLNTAFGIIGAWTISKFQFHGKRLLITLIDLPLTVSPVVAGLLFILLFGSHGWLGEWLKDEGINIIFAFPGLVLAAIFVSSPFVLRQLLPLMVAQGSDQEEAALTLGAKGLQVFFFITLPRIKWALLHGVLLCAARSMGEFGAVSVVSGHIRGLTNTLPLHIEILYNEYQFVAAFSAASVLAILSILVLIVKSILESRLSRSRGKKGNEYFVA